MKTIVIALLFVYIVRALGSGLAPQPYCLSKPLYKQFPLVTEQILSHDMDDSFSGYNLNIQMTSNSSNFATLSKKFRQLDRMNTYITQIISHYIQKKDNTVGKDSFMLYKDITGSYHFTYGVISDKSSLPQFNTTMIVVSDKNVRCFDAALFLDYGLAIVDCLRINTSNLNQLFTNLFFYLDLTGHKVTKIISNQVYSDFKMVSKRKFVKFTNPQTHYPYLIRSYFAEGVINEKDNTYIQFFGAQDPYDLQIFEVVDRTFLHQYKLAINDLEVYNGDIFFLDSFVGLYRLDVTKDHKLVITGKMKKVGFSRFSVYSDDLEDQIIVALSNSHNIYEIDWSWQYMFQHQVISKYTIPSDSEVRDIKINGQYIIVQSKANVTNSLNSTYEVDYTWIFTKNSRTYMNAYQVIQHNSSKVDIDFDPSLNHIYTADEGGLALFKIDQARLNLHNINSTLIGKKENIVITATSTDPVNKNKSANCSIVMTVIFVQKEDLTIYPTQYQMNTQYSANYPGNIYIPLDNRFLGPNISFSAYSFQGDNPTSWVDKVNKTIFNLNTSVRPQDVTFFHTDMIQEYGQEELVYFFQDTTNKTYIAECIHAWEELTIGCKVTKQYQHDSRLGSFTTAFVIDEDAGDWDFYYFMVLQGKKNQVRMIDFIKHQIVTNITYFGHQEAQIHHIASSNGYLYVLRKFVKTIDVYNIVKCKNKLKCTLEFQITMPIMKSLGVDYFSPQQIITNAEHPEVLFIKCLGSVVVLDVDNKNKLHLMDQISSDATKDPNFRIAVNKYRMVLVSQPNIIMEYNLQAIYQKDSLTVMKVYPTYGYKIQPDADVQFSDLDTNVYVNAYDPQTNVSVILVYRSGYPSSAVLYHTIYLDQLYSRPGFQIEVSGGFVDFVSIIAGDNFHVYRVFQSPLLNIDTSVHDFNFSIKAINKKSNQFTQKIGVSIVNFPQGFKPTKQFIDTYQNLKITTQNNYTWNDRKWFIGHVLNYNYSCYECKIQKSKIKIRQHLDSIRTLDLAGNDYIQTNTFTVSVNQDLIFYQHNGSVKSIVYLPDQKLLQTCLKVSAYQTGQFIVTACQQLGRGINLYLTNLQSFKPITLGPFQSDAYHARSLQVVYDVVMVVNQNAYPEFRIMPGSVFLYRASLDADTLEQFQFLDEIDNDDFLAAHGWTKEEATIGNAYLAFSTLTNTFRLYISELENGFFVIDFTRHSWEAQIHILSVQYVDMNEILKSNKFHLPSDATYQAITFTGIEYNQHFQIDRVLITTKGYHNFQVLLVYDESDKIQSCILHRVYYRYGFYQANNEVKTVSGYVAISYTIPRSYSIYPNYPKQHIAVYDSSDYQHQSDKGYSQRYILCAFPINFRQPATFAFNQTYDEDQNGARIGLIVADQSHHSMFSASISKTLQVEVQKNYVNQTLKVTAYSDFQQYTFNVSIYKKGGSDDDDDDDDHHGHEDHSKTDETLFIIVVIAAAVIIIVFGSYIFYVVRKRTRTAVTEQRVSLLTSTESFVNDVVPRNSVSQQNDLKPLVREDSGYSSGDEQEKSVEIKIQAPETAVESKIFKPIHQRQALDTVEHKIQQKIYELINERQGPATAQQKISELINERQGPATAQQKIVEPIIEKEGQGTTEYKIVEPFKTQPEKSIIAQKLIANEQQVEQIKAVQAIIEPVQNEQKKQ